MHPTCCAYSHSHSLSFPAPFSLPLAPLFPTLSLSGKQDCSFYFQVQRKWNYCRSPFQSLSRSLSLPDSPFFAYTFTGVLRKWSKHEIDIINTQLETLQMSFDETETAREPPRATTTGFCVALLLLLSLVLLYCNAQREKYNYLRDIYLLWEFFRNHIRRDPYIPTTYKF